MFGIYGLAFLKVRRNDAHVGMVHSGRCLLRHRDLRKRGKRLWMRSGQPSLTQRVLPEATHWTFECDEMLCEALSL